MVTDTVFCGASADKGFDGTRLGGLLFRLATIIPSNNEHADRGHNYNLSKYVFAPSFVRNFGDCLRGAAGLPFWFFFEPQFRHCLNVLIYLSPVSETMPSEQ